MAIEVTLAWDEGPAKEVEGGASRTLRYEISGTDDREAAVAALMANAEYEVGGLLAASYDVERVGDEEWDGIVGYGAVEYGGKIEPPMLAHEFSMSGGGWQKFIKHSLQTIDVKTNGFVSPPDFKQLINVVMEDGFYTPKGLQLGGEEDTFQVSATLDSISASFLSKLWRYRRCMNSVGVEMNIDGVRASFDPGELLFLYADVHYRRSDRKWMVTEHWSASENVEGLSVGDITGINKRGFDYLWFLEQTTLSGDPKVLQIVPWIAYVEQVYETRDLNELAL